MEPHEHWRIVYETKQPNEVSWYQPVPAASLAALERAGADPSMSLVDVGGGAASLVDALLDRGWRDLTIVDIAEPALAASRARLGPRAALVRWEAVDIREWRPRRAFDIWHDRAVFHFLTEAADRAAYTRTLIAATQPGSSVILATFAVDGPEKCSGLAVRRYDAASLAAELGQDFLPLAAWRETHVTPWGAEQNFQWSVLRRR